ncbi:hypothetical protein LIER_09613 [Lithospermum erythrorhizon]|uniref:Uncharacterized protein n=1 Tax=Lithospermum erythrorhizon TaxID=34254 RepID=A0AAV3PGH0_LITER
MSKLEAWSNKHLVLVNTVIFGNQNYWCQNMFLPVAVIKKIEEAVRRFLWKGNMQGHYMSKVKWKNVTEAKEAGGLGIKNLREWNTVCMIGQIKSGSFWSLEGKSTDTSIWRQLLKKKECVRHLIKVKIGDGKSTNFMHDNWHPRGILTHIFLDEAKRT